MCCVDASGSSVVCSCLLNHKEVIMDIVGRIMYFVLGAVVTTVVMYGFIL